MPFPPNSAVITSVARAWAIDGGGGGGHPYLNGTVDRNPFQTWIFKRTQFADDVMVQCSQDNRVMDGGAGDGLLFIDNEEPNLRTRRWKLHPVGGDQTKVMIVCVENGKALDAEGTPDRIGLGPRDENRRFQHWHLE